MFKLNFDIPESPFKINLIDPLLLIGSCFSDEIGRQLNENKFQSLSNPYGTIYNPHSIFKLLSGKSDPKNIVESQGVHYHWDAHGAISGLSQSETITLFENKQHATHKQLGTAKYLIITLGTAIVYEHNENGIVGNCHKIPSARFSKRFLHQDEILQEYEALHSYLKSSNPDLHIILTISPVRHIRDGLVENNRSKSILIDSVHSIVNAYQDTVYFPSYEIIVDELRDYRFFATDRVHPSHEAIQYVWERFSETYFDVETKHFLNEWHKVKAAINHIPFQPQSKSHQLFLKKTLNKLISLNEKVDLHVEIEEVSNQLQ